MYTDQLRTSIISTLDEVHWVKKIEGFNKVAMYRLNTTRPFFSLNGQQVTAKLIGENTWEFAFPLRTKPSEFTVLFHYDPLWRLTIDGKKLLPINTKYNLQSYAIPAGKEGKVILQYLPMQNIHLGSYVSFAMVIIFCVSLLL